MVLYFLIAGLTKYLYMTGTINILPTLESLYLLKPIIDYMIFVGFARRTVGSTLVEQ